MAEVKKEFFAKGTSCESCNRIIKKEMSRIEGVKRVSFDYRKEKGTVVFDGSKTDIGTILSGVGSYECTQVEDGSKWKKGGLAFALLGLVLAAYFISYLSEAFSLPALSQTTGYGLLFVAGLLTGFHCVGMCGGFVLGYTTKSAQEGKRASHLMYGTGKTISYTVIGGLFGLLGAFIAFTPKMRGMIGLIAGLFLIFYGIRMLNIFPILRNFRLRTPGFISRRLGKSGNSPLVVGLLNGGMIACGPLQAVYILAMGTGSMIEGAKLLFIFGLGTLPVMLSFGYYANYISGKATAGILKISAGIVILLGLLMINNGLVLTGSGYDFSSVSGYVSDKSRPVESASEGPEGIVMEDGYQVIRMDVLASGWSPNSFVLKKGVPVKWIINGKEITSCNNAIQVPKYGLEFGIKKGEQVIEFTPTEAGTVRWSCWMGMIPGTFIVKDDVGSADDIKRELENVPVQKAGGCGCGGMVGANGQEGSPFGTCGLR